MWWTYRMKPWCWSLAQHLVNIWCLIELSFHKVLYSCIESSVLLRVTCLLVRFAVFEPISKMRCTNENPMRIASNIPDYEGKKKAAIDSDSPTRSTSDDQHFPPENIQKKQNSIQALPDGNDLEYATGFTAVSHHVHHHYEYYPHRPGIRYRSPRHHWRISLNWQRWIV